MRPSVLKPRPQEILHRDHWMMRNLKFWAPMWEQGGRNIWDIVGREQGAFAGDSVDWILSPNRGRCVVFGGDTANDDSRVEFSAPGTNSDGDTPITIALRYYHDTTTTPLTVARLVYKELAGVGFYVAFVNVGPPHHLVFRIGVGAGASNGYQWRNNTAVLDDQWVSLVCTYDGSRTAAGFKVYQNGIELTDTDGSGTFPAGSPSTSQALGIGNETVTPSEAFSGPLDDVRIYVGNAWSLAQIREWDRNPWAMFEEPEQSLFVPPRVSHEYLPVQITRARLLPILVR